MIGKLDRRITLKAWSSEQDDTGAPVKTLIKSYSMWAKVESRNGRMFLNHDQTTWDYDYKITVRYERSRLIASNMTIDYDGKRLTISSVSFDAEGNRIFSVLRCSTTDEQITSDDGEVIPETVTLGFNTFDYYGIGSETEWQSNQLINKTIIGAFKDGQNFDVITDGTPEGKQVFYDTGTGTLTWSTPYVNGEYTLIQYI